MKRLVLVARLLPGTEAKAQSLLEAGPPFDPARVGLTRHLAYSTGSEVVFVFEGPEVEWTVDDLVNHPIVAAALEPWRKVGDGLPRIAEELYAWEPPQDADSARTLNVRRGRLCGGRSACSRPSPLPPASRAGRGRGRSGRAPRASPAGASA